MRDDHTLTRYLREALADLSLSKDGLGWYEANRHTTASQFLMADGHKEREVKITDSAA